MVDLPASAVSSAPSTTTSQGSGGSDSGIQSAPAGIINLPPNLQTLNQVVTLGARLVGANSDGSVVLRTAQGDVTVTVPINLPAGTPLQLQFQPGTPPTAVIILPGPNPGATLANQASQVVQNVINNLPLPEIDFGSATAAATNSTLTNLQTGVTVRALVLDPSVGSLPPIPTNSPLGVLLSQPGALANLLEQIAGGGSGSAAQDARAQLLGQLGTPGPMPSQIGQLALPARLLETIQTTLQLLQQQPGGLQGLSNNQNSLQALQIAIQNLPGAAQTAGAAQNSSAGTIILPGAEVNLKLVQIILPGQATGQAAVPTPGSLTITGQLTSQTFNGQPVVQTEQGPVLLQAGTKLPPGTTLVFELVENAAGARAGAAALNPGVLGMLDGIKTNSAMPRLEQTLMLLGQNDPEALTTLMNSLPKLNLQFPITSLFFMQALSSGDIRNWLGDGALKAIQKLGPGGAGLVEELEKEFADVGARAQNTQPGEWRQVTIPYQGEYGLATMRFAVRNHFQPIDPDEQRRHGLSEDAGRVTRFLFDINFSELGPLQVDGLLRPRMDYQKQLDILLRTREMLPTDMRGALRDLFEQSLSAYGMHGGLAFQAGFQNWVKLANARSANPSASV